MTVFYAKLDAGIVCLCSAENTQKQCNLPLKYYKMKKTIQKFKNKIIKQTNKLVHKELPKQRIYF